MATADPVYDPALTGGGVTLSQGTLAGRGSASGTGTEEAITLGAGLALTGTVLDTTGAGSGGAATNEPFITAAATAGLSAERVATTTATIAFTDGTTTATWNVVDNSISNAKLRQGAARSVIGVTGNATANVADIAGGGAGTYARDSGTALAFSAITEIIQNLALSGDISPTQITASQNDYSPTSLSTSSVLRLDLDAARAITGIAGGADGRVLGLFNTSAFVLTLTDASASSTAANRFDFGADLALGAKHGALLWYDSTSSRWRLLSRAFPFTAAASTITLTAGAGLAGGGDLSTNRSFAVAAGDSSITVNADDIIVATDGITTVKILDANVTYAKIQNVAALSVVGRSANSSGVAAAISAVAASDSVFRESGSVVGFGTVATAGIANNAITDAKLRQGVARSVVGVTGNATANVADIQGTADQVLRVNGAGTAVAFGTIAAGGIASDAVTTAKILDANVTDAKLANMGARTVKGRSANSTGVPADIAGGGAGTYANDSGTALAFTAVTDIIQNLNISGDISPTQIAANTNDYNPTSLATSTTLRLTTDADRTITGLAGGVDGRVITLINVGSFPATLSDADTGSTAANRFSFGFSICVLPGRALVLWYDSTSSRWRRYNTDVGQVVHALTDGASITVSMDAGSWKKVTLGGARTMSAPTGAKYHGMLLGIDIFQDGTGSRTITWTSGAGAYRFTDATTGVGTPTLSTGVSKCDYILFKYNTTDDRWDAIDFVKAA